MTIREILASSNLAPLDAELLLCDVTKKNREYLFTHLEKTLPVGHVLKFRKLTKKRDLGEPIAYLIRKKEFYGLNFKVNASVLIPRPETEILVEKVINLVNQKRAPKKCVFADIGTGSGNIAISVYKNLAPIARKNVLFLASDISKDALKMARNNAKALLGDNHQIQFFPSDMANFLIPRRLALKDKTLIISANLPYLDQREFENCAPDIKEYEPKKALVSNFGGLGHYRNLFKMINDNEIDKLSSAVICFMEINPHQKAPLQESIHKIFSNAKIEFYNDLSGNTRVAKLEITTASIN